MLLWKGKPLGKKKDSSIKFVCSGFESDKARENGRQKVTFALCHVIPHVSEVTD